MTTRALTRCALSLCLSAATLSAHGGAYRGPTVTMGRGVTAANPSTPSGPLAGPTTGAPGVPGAPPASAAAFTPDVTRWQVWWELNKDAYLRAPRIALDPRAPESIRPMIPDKQKVEEILPALERAMAATTNQHVTSACMIALGKIGLDHPRFKILDLFRQRLRRGNQEIREVAALAMGIAKRPEAIDDLAALLQDTGAGRRLMGRDSVDDRTRTFAAYGLGLIARGNRDVAVKERAFAALAATLDERKLRDRDIQSAILNSMRLIDPDPRVDARHRRLLWQVLQRLGKFRDPSTSKSRQSVQSHVAPAVARLLGRGSTPDHQRAKQDLVDQLGSRRKLHANLLQSAALGLGQLLLPGEDLPADAESGKALWRHYDTTRDQQTRHFILIAAGQIGGETNFERVAREFRTGKREIQAWAALSLGLMAFHAPKVKPQAGAQGPVKDVRAMTGLLLHGGLLRINNRDVRAAIALGLGLCGHKAAAADMRRLLEKYRRVEEFAGYLCMGLALMDDKAAGAQIQAVMGDSSRRPLLMSQAALALGRLRHPGASTTLRALLQTGGVFGTLTLASTATAMGYLADPKNVAPLIRILGDTGHNSLVRAFAAVALGSMAENDPLTWSAWVAMNMNYSAAAETLSNGSSGILDIL